MRPKPPTLTESISDRIINHMFPINMENSDWASLAEIDPEFKTVRHRICYGNIVQSLMHPLVLRQNWPNCQVKRCRRHSDIDSPQNERSHFLAGTWCECAYDHGGSHEEPDFDSCEGRERHRRRCVPASKAVLARSWWSANRRLSWRGLVPGCSGVGGSQLVGILPVLACMRTDDQLERYPDGPG